MGVRNCRTIVAILLTFVFAEGCSDRGSDPPPPPVVPVITEVSPDSLRVSEVARIHGYGFERYNAAYSVVFSNNIPAITYLEWEDTEIKCIVPSGAVSGPVHIRKGALVSNGYNVLVIGTQSTQLILNQTGVSVSVGQTVNVTVSGGTAPYTIQTPPNSSVATAFINGSTVTVSGVGQGTTTVVIADATLPTPLTATLTVEVTAQQSTVSFSQDIQPIFNASCVGCHGGSGGLFLTAGQSYDNLVNVQAQAGCTTEMRVQPGNAGASVLYKRVSGTSCGEQMPRGGPPLSAAHIQKIMDWINQGALNN